MNKMVSLPEVARARGMPSRTLQQWCSQGKVLGKKINGKWYIDKEIVSTIPLTYAGKRKKGESDSYFQDSPVQLEIRKKRQEFSKFSNLIDDFDFLLKLLAGKDVQLDRLSLFDLFEGCIRDGNYMFSFTQRIVPGLHKVSIKLGKVVIMEVTELAFDKFFSPKVYRIDRFENIGHFCISPYDVLHKLRIMDIDNGNEDGSEC